MNEGWLDLTGDGSEQPRDDITGWCAAMTLAGLTGVSPDQTNGLLPPRVSQAAPSAPA